MIWHILRYLTSLVLPVFYKRIQAKNIKNIQVKGPVIIAMNHPNAFADPVAFTAVCYPPRLKYMARGDAFKPGLVTWLLQQIGIVPVFRIQDGGRDGLKKNDDAYRRVNQLLKRNAKVIIFAEGLCVQERRIRPLKKGLARMVFGAYEHLKNDKLIVVPVGINYSWPSKFRSNLLYNIGEPVYVKDFIEEYKQNPARAQNTLLAELEQNLKELVSHINAPENDEAVYMAEQLCKKDWMKDQGLNRSDLYHQLIIQKQLTALVNKAAASNNPALAEFKTVGKDYFTLINQNRLRDWLINPRQNKNASYPLLYLRYMLLLITLPLYITGLAGNLLPLVVIHRLSKKLAKKREFYASMAIGTGTFIFLFNYLLWFFAVYAFYSTIFPPLLVCVAFILCGVACLYYHPFMLKTFGMARLFGKPETAAKLLQQRKKLLALINKF